MSGMMVGLTHDENGQPIIRAPRTLKVGIGVPKGRAIRVFIHPTSKEWYVVKGALEGNKLKEISHRFKTRAEAEAFYNAEKATAPVVGYPRKLNFFTFSRPGLTPEGAEVYEPDFEAIEATGPVPTEIKVVFMSADPFDGAYQFWSASELRCRGNGIDAMRLVSFEPTNPDAIEARKNGQRNFPILGGCWARGCKYANNGCKVGSTLNFQLARSVRVGGTAFFHTTGFRSTADIFSSLEEIKAIVNLATGRNIIGIPMMLKLRPYLTKPEGQKAATQYAVRVEMDSVEIGKLQEKLLTQSFQSQIKQIAAPAEEVTEAIETIEDELPLSPQAMADEFYPEAETEEPPAPKPAVTAAAATQEKQVSIGEKLKARREAADPAPEISTPPWTDEASMRAALKTERDRLGEKPFYRHFTEAGMMLGQMKFDDPRSFEIYQNICADGGGLF